MTVQFSSAQAAAQQYQLPPPPDPQVDAAGYQQWLEGNAAYVGEPAYHPQLGELVPANDPQVAATGGTFADQVRGTQPQATLDHDMALLSQDVYNADSAGPIGAGNWTRVSADELRANNINTPLANDSTGFQAAVYRNDQGQYVVAFAGTDPTSIRDWITNGGQGLGFETSQYSDAMSLVQEVATEFPGQVAVTGHSLGGGLASAGALAADVPAVTFNAAGLSDQTLRDLNLSPNAAREYAADGLVRRYSVENDILTGAQSGISPLPEAVGAHLRLENTYLIQDPIRAHLMPAVLSGLEAGNPMPVEQSALGSAIARPGEVAVDLAGNAVRETIGLGSDVVGAGGELLSGIGEAGQDLLAGRPADAVLGLTGDVVDAGLNVAGDVVDHGLNLAGDVVQSAGTLTGGWIRDAGNAVGLEGVGNTVGGWVENGTQWAGDRLDDAGTWIGDGLEAAGDWVGNSLDTAGGWISDRASDVGNWLGDRASDVGDWAGDRWNDFKESNWNPGNWF